MKCGCVARRMGGLPPSTEAKRLQRRLITIGQLTSRREVSWSRMAAVAGLYCESGDNGAPAEVRRVGGANVVRAPMPGTMIEVLVGVGDEVEAGQTLAVMEAMKMEHLLTAPNAGVVAAIHTAAGASVDEDAVLIELGAAT